MRTMMKEIGDLLRTYIEQSGYTIYGISKAAGINRSTLQKVLLENRKPSDQLIQLLLPLLKLSPEEKQELLTTVEFMNCGKELYTQRLYIKEMLEHTADILYGNNVPSVRFHSTASPDIPYENSQIFRGEFAVEKVLNEMIEHETYMEAPKIKIHIPGNAKLVSHVLMHTLYYCTNYNLLEIQHIICLVQTDTGTSLSPDNLSILGNIVPFICASDFHYRACYRYRDWESYSQNVLTAFPYYITGSSWCFLISKDCSTAMYCSLPETVRYLNQIFDTQWEHTTPLSSTYTKPEDILPVFIKMNHQDLPLVTLECQPCLSAYLDERIIRNYARKDIAHYEETVQQVLFRAMQLHGITSQTSLFTKPGLLGFVKTGYLTDFPSAYAHPLLPEDRILLLECLYGEIAENKQSHRMINPVNFSVSECFSYFITKTKGIVFLGYNKIHSNYDYILIEEPGITNAFFDFSNYLTQSSYVYSKHDTLEFIRQCIRSLQ